jgi:hypothetical protein
MKKLLGFLILIISIVLLLPLQSFSQTSDTLDVPEKIDNNPLGAINKTINGDTTATGEYAHIYRLGRGKIYLMDAAIVNRHPLTIVAEEPADPQNPTRPPVLVPGILQDGSYPGVFFWAENDLTLKGLYIHCFLPDVPGNQWSNGWLEPVVPRGDSCTYVFDNLIFDGAGAAIVSKGKWQKITLTNSLARNGVAEATWYLGHFFLTDGLPIDTLIMVNNTGFNCGGFNNFTWGANYMLYEHNTIFTTHVNPFWAGGGVNRDIKNNIIYAPFMKGAKVVLPDYDERGWSEYDGLVYSVTSVDTLEPAMLADFGKTESERYINWENNAYFWPPAVTDFWTFHADSVFPITWMNSRTEAMFADDVNYPNLHMNGNLNVDPGFNQDMMDQVEKAVDYVEMFTTNSMDVYRHYYPSDDPNAVYFPPPWPLTEDLAYTNTDLMTAGTDGFPLGDLNWFPDKKAEWEQWITAVEPEDNGEMVPAKFTLHQNYPNPFNPSTTIKFNLEKAAKVSLTIYDITGKNVQTIYENTYIKAGLTEVKIDMSRFSSGLYFYALDNGKSSDVKKMVLIK